jgi:hypothetical protein
MALTGIGSQTQTQRTSASDATEQPSSSTATQETQPAQQEARIPAAQDIVNGVRERLQGIGDAIRDRIDGLAPGEPVAGTWKPCGRGKCTANAPVRGLGGDTA